MNRPTRAMVSSSTVVRNVAWNRFTRFEKPTTKQSSMIWSCSKWAERSGVKAVIDWVHAGARLRVPDDGGGFVVVDALGERVVPKMGELHVADVRCSTEQHVGRHSVVAAVDHRCGQVRQFTLGGRQGSGSVEDRASFGDDRAAPGWLATARMMFGRPENPSAPPKRSTISRIPGGRSRSPGSTRGSRAMARRYRQRTGDSRTADRRSRNTPDRAFCAWFRTRGAILRRIVRGLGWGVR